MNNEKLVNSQDIMNFATGYIFDSSEDDKLSSVWKKVVSKIGKKKEEQFDEVCIGERLAGNTKVIDLKNEILLIETNHSGWIQYLKMYQRFIINGIKWELPELSISTLAFRIAGTSISLSDIYEDSYKKNLNEYNKKVDDNQKILEEKFGKADNSEYTNNLPPEILEKFNNMKKDLK